MMSLRSFGAAGVVAVLAFVAAPSAMASAAAPAARLASPPGTQAAPPTIDSPFAWPRPAGGNIYICQSPNRHSLFTFQTDGNLVDYDEFGRARWSSRTAGRGDFISFDSYGGLEVLDDGQFVWSNDMKLTYLRGAHLTCQDDGNVVIYTFSGFALWSTRTVH